MPEFYEPLLDFTVPERQNILGIILSLRDPVDGETLRWAVDRMRARFPYFYVRAVHTGNGLVPVPNGLPMTVRNTWEPIRLHSEASNGHLAAWKYEGRRLAFEIHHALTDGPGVMPYIRSILFLYLSKVTGQTFDPAGFRLPGDVIPESETGNPFCGPDIDNAEAPLYRKKPIPGFFRLAEPADTGKTVFFVKLSEAQVMQYCRDFDGSPNVIVSVLLAKAARRWDPGCEKTITVSVCVDRKAVLGNHNNYRMFTGEAILDFPMERDMKDLAKTCTIARGQLMLQAQPENIRWEIQQMKRAVPPPPPDTAQASICVSYINSRSFGPLDPFIEELYTVTSLSKITDVLCEITCINHSFFLAFMQPFSSRKYFRCFLDELDAAGISCECLRSEPLRMCGI